MKKATLIKGEFQYMTVPLYNKLIIQLAKAKRKKEWEQSRVTRRAVKKQEREMNIGLLIEKKKYFTNKINETNNKIFKSPFGFLINLYKVELMPTIESLKDKYTLTLSHGRILVYQVFA